ncbi:TIGR03089 family protein [Actinoallomurus iriomotensis]|uniref:Acyl-CoA synthetase n=1 Tax=Actinoallomurus iriomotensis TaxID=478107 RepID=A0A9W6RMU4_9ACTN|nr:TIGR03089 family protein [Actinoallomurus iriomotensis]GLY76902.1 acyl-CoA synthetase [Actinoallomurus iriomotensis]
MSHPVDLLRGALAAEPSRPLVTFYDDATGERVELSVKTFDNWVAKTANLLLDGLAADPGARVALALPVHWQTAAWLFACWSAGLTAIPVDEGEIPADADIVAAGPGRLEAALAATGSGHAEVVGLSLHALGAPLAECPPGVTDYAVEVRSYGDHFTGVTDADAPAVEIGGEVMSGARLVAAGEALGLPPGTRTLTTVSYATPEGLLSGLIGPLASQGSVIICQNLEQSGLDRRISLERATALVTSPSL